MKNTENLSMKDLATEEKIKIAAERLFMENGFSATRTRDIAEAAGINLALLNYYYRSKENLFNIIVMEKMDMFFNLIVSILNDETISFEKKIEQLVHRYSDLMIENPQLPLFLMSAIQRNPDLFAEKTNIKERVSDMKNNFIGKENEIQFMMDVFSVIVFPFILRNAFEVAYGLDKDTYDDLMNKRRAYLPGALAELYARNKVK